MKDIIYMLPPRKKNNCGGNNWSYNYYFLFIIYIALEYPALYNR